jgi:hypothetical protein
MNIRSQNWTPIFLLNSGVKQVSGHYEGHGGGLRKMLQLRGVNGLTGFLA